MLLIIVGFCLPLAYGLNGFQIAASDTVQSIPVSSFLSFALYGLFITAVIGFLFYFLDDLLLEVNTLDFLWDIAQSKIINLIVVAICVCFGLIPFFINLKEHGGSYQIGIILIIIGCVSSLVFHIISIIMENTEGTSCGSSRYNSSGTSSSTSSSNVNGASTSSSDDDDDDYPFPDVCP